MVAQAGLRVGHDREQLLNLIGGHPLRLARRNARPFERVAGIRLEQPHADEEPVERAEARNAGPHRDRRRAFPGEPDDVRVAEHILAIDLVRGLAHPGEERLKHLTVRRDGAQ
jgi:hypothetical protein